MDRCYKQYIQRIEDDLSTNLKAFWRYTKNKKETNIIPSCIKLKDRVVDAGEDIVNLFAEYFSSVYNRETNDSYVPEFVSTSFSTYSITISATDILTRLKSLDTNKAAGPDGIPPIFIKLCAPALLKPLSLIFNKSLSEGTFPSLWKLAKITPVFKSGDKIDATNYRPISILNCFAKVFEGIAYDHLYNHLKHRLNPKQHGFVSGKSTTTNLLEYATFISESFNNRVQTDAIYTDFSKAFDRVDHSILLKKLNHLGIHGSLHRWLTSYLMNRSQLVSLYGYDSMPFLASSGVPQGSNLGPLLFLAFINDLLDNIDSPCLAYADDIKVFRRINTHEDCHILQKDVDLINDWCLSNLMSLNAKKCQVITFTKNRSYICFNYHIAGVYLERVEVIRDLGVMFDSSFSFRPHYDYIANKSNRMLGFVLRTAKPFKNSSSWILLYNSLVRSILEYCSSIWFPIYNVHVDRLESIQRRFLRSLCTRLGLRRRIKEYEDRLDYFKLKSLESRRAVTDMCHLYKIVNGFYGPDLLGNIQIRVPTRTMRNYKLFSIPYTTNNVSGNSPVIRMCNLYNDLYETLIISNSKDILGCSYSSFQSCLRSKLT